MVEVLARHTGLYIKTNADKGRGLFCANRILGQDIIEQSPVIVFNQDDASIIDKTVLYNYYFSAKFLSDLSAKDLELGDKEKSGMIALGMISLCNHSENPNAIIEKIAQGKDIVFSLRALRDIEPDEEISISYGKVWFDVLL